jgi:hypothetical protein
MWCPPIPWGAAPHSHVQPSAGIRQSSPPGSHQTCNCKSRIQLFRICWHHSPFKITMGLPVAHGAKKYGSCRPCVDYHWLNLITTPDKYPVPKKQDLSNGMHGCSMFSKINLVKGYHQIPVAEVDIPKIAIITPFGLFEYLFTPFGLSNAAQTFQLMMDRTIDGPEGVSSRFVWHGLSSDITSWAGSCLHCQQSKIHHHLRLTPQPIPIPQR